MQPVVSVSPAIISAGKFPFNPASNFKPVLINRKRPDIAHKSDKLFALTLKRKAPAADSFHGHYRFYAIIHPFRNEEHMVTILDFVHSTFVLSVHILLKHISTSGSMRMPSFVSGIAGVAFSIIFVIIFISFLFDFQYCRHILSTLPICRILPAAKHRQNAKAPLPAKTAGLKNKERNEHDGESVLCIEEILLPHLLYILYQIFRQAQIFVGFFSLAADDDNRHSMQHPAAGTIFVSWYPESCIPPAAFCRPPPLYTSKRSLTPAIVLLDRPVLSRPPYLLYRANLRLPFANNPSFQAPSAPATTFHEP